ncbi:hypothetical protein HPB52_002727 [Rhipicephalus sanguineus]|uniref:Uncharacterized protein n=1 Tax=Rhipicephalus sanguineus TaxID=34632 RepID=A0A9D4SRB9_RHISA|nr:hypothetical protein HPB52_002727 [Rhipicephalus sanguineus]
MGRGGRMLQARSHHARIVVRVLLVQHSCVEILHLDDVLIEGSELGEYRECVVSALRENRGKQLDDRNDGQRGCPDANEHCARHGGIGGERR